MKSSSNTNMNRTVSRRSGGDKKKAIVAFGLLLVMAFMWIKVFSGKKNVQSAKAASQQEQIQEQPKFEISYITMPNISGRNDNLSRDIFDSDQWSGFKVKGGSKRVATGFDVKQDGNGSQIAKTVKRVAEGLRLEAILGGDLPQAFINNNLLSAGQHLVVPYKGRPYEFEVVSINENEVELKCFDVVVTKKIIQP